MPVDASYRDDAGPRCGEEGRSRWTIISHRRNDDVSAHDQLLDDIWSGSVRKNIQYLRILVRDLRQIIEPDPNHPRLLITESGVGYRLQSRLEDITLA